MKDRDFLRSITEIYEDDDVLVLNKPMGLAVKRGSGTTQHIDGMLGALRQGQPSMASVRAWLYTASTRIRPAVCWWRRRALPPRRWPKTFRTRAARKIYWALVAGVPKPKQGRVSTYLAKQQEEEDSYHAHRANTAGRTRRRIMP